MQNVMRTITGSVVIAIGLVACDTADEEPIGDSVPAEERAADAPALETETGEASLYADVLDRQRTASGEPLDQDDLVAAHPRYPFGTILEVTNLRNDRSVEVRVIDRGPFTTDREGRARVIDVSRAAADELGFRDVGTAPVRVDVVEYGDGLAR